MVAGKLWIILLVLPASVKVSSIQNRLSVDLGNLSETLCSETMCFRRCCTRDQVLLDSVCTTQNSSFGDESFFQDLTAFFGLQRSFVIVNSNERFCSEGLGPVFQDLSSCSLKENQMHCIDLQNPNEYQHYRNYCIEYFVDNNSSTLNALGCYGNDREGFTINGIGKSTFYQWEQD